jgi:hypothetical protein
MSDTRPRQTPPKGAPRPGPSVYAGRERAKHAREWVHVAAEDPVTGALRWEEDWPRLVTGWWPLEEFMRDRWGWS